MNFLSHFFLDKTHQDSVFLVGVCVPDLLSIYSRSLRIKRLSHHLVFTTPIQQFYRGVVRHYDTDKVFHTCDFFERECLSVARDLRELFPEGRVQRSNFVAHVMIEIIIDKILISADKSLVEDFYSHFNQVGIPKITEMTETLLNVPISTFSGFLQKFIENQYLYHYESFEYIIFVLKRIVGRVGIVDTAYMDSPLFLEYLREYEKKIMPEINDLFLFLENKLENPE